MSVWPANREQAFFVHFLSCLSYPGVAGVARAFPVIEQKAKKDKIR